PWQPRMGSVPSVRSGLGSSGPERPTSRRRSRSPSGLAPCAYSAVDQYWSPFAESRKGRMTGPDDEMWMDAVRMVVGAVFDRGDGAGCERSVRYLIDRELVTPEELAALTSPRARRARRGAGRPPRTPDTPRARRDASLPTCLLPPFSTG